MPSLSEPDPLALSSPLDAPGALQMAGVKPSLHRARDALP